MAESRVKKTTLACDSCRRRKRKCDGRTPVCSLCEKGGIECVYDATQDQRRPAQKNYVAALEARVALLENILRDAGASDVAGPSGTGIDQTEENDLDLPQPPEPVPQATLTQSTVALNPNTEPTFVPTDDASTDALRLMAQPQVEQNADIEELDLGMGGYEPGASLELEHQLLAQFWDWQRMHLPYVAPVPFLSAYAVFSETAHPGEPIPPPPPPPPPNPFSGPTAIGVPRARDVQLTSDLAQFISPLLLDAMFAIAALFHGNAEISDRFYERAKQRLFEEAAKPRLATVQATTLMSTWELGHARAPATWTLLGVAVALCIRLGMNVDATPLVRSGAIFGATCMGLHPLMDRRIISTPRHSSLAAANVLDSAKKEETSANAGSSSSASQSDRPTASDPGTTWWNPSTLGMGDVLIQAGWEALRDLIRMSDMLYDGIYAFNAPKRTPQEILELVTRNNLTIQRFLDDLPTWMRSTGAIRRKDNGLVYLHLFTHLTSILTCRPFLSPPAPSGEVGSSVGSVSQSTSSSHIIRRYRTLAFRVARASALQIMSLVRHIPLSSPCVTIPYAVYSASTILLLSPEDPAAMDGVRTGLTCLDSMDETGYWVDSAKDGGDRIRALARRWSVVVGPGKRILGPLPASSGSGPSGTGGASGSQDNSRTGGGGSAQGTHSTSLAAGGANIPSGSQSGQVSAGTTRPSTNVGSSARPSDSYTPIQPALHSQAISPDLGSLQSSQGYGVHAPQAFSESTSVDPIQQYGDLPLQESEIDAAIAQALEAFGSTQKYSYPPAQNYSAQPQSTETQYHASLQQADHISGQPNYPDPPQAPQPSQYVPPPQYARDPLAMRRRQQERQSQGDQGQFQQSQYSQQAQHHHPYTRQPKPTRKRQPMNHVAYALSHAEPQHDLHIDHNHWHTVLPPTDPNLPFPPDPTACTDMAACFSHTVEYSHDPAFVNSMTDPYAAVAVDWLSDIGSSFPAMTFDTFYSPSQAGPSSGAAGPSAYMQGPGGYEYMGGPGM
ncbi:Nitrogen assimilation transcription factor nit-4 [Neurospora crassa OR74A] [Rhizoctonia solani]|uniref:Nitrogen assimilation transcription factor nit-4 [Neurospora crassa OR74A] n=1 Tax=Rhizoctonia solani TaxID=456999 RepID=A0A0K6FLW5_9AGAM|nr:Nitrogen assimilation transcription factor nit-4 [Neurospora crassa OR74A] [Rhizoctonia solani]